MTARGCEPPLSPARRTRHQTGGVKRAASFASTGRRCFIKHRKSDDAILQTMHRRYVSLSVAILAVLTAITSPGSSAAAAFQAQTAVSVKGTLFTINGRATYPGTAARGLLLNTRMVQAVFDDANPDTTWQWEYPDTHVWDPQRNTDEFVAMLPRYAAKGV